MRVLILALLVCAFTRADMLLFSAPDVEVGFTPMSDDQVAMETMTGLRVPQLSDTTTYYESNEARKSNLQVSESRLNHQVESVRLPRKIHEKGILPTKYNLCIFQGRHFRHIRV